MKCGIKISDSLTLRCGLFILAALLWTTPGWADGGTLKVVPQADVKVLDPNFTTADITQLFSYMIYDQLFNMNSKMEPQPQMVETFQLSADATTYTFTLRPGLKFHDGQPVRGADVVASLKRWGNQGIGNQLLRRSEHYKVLTENSFEIKLKKPWSITLRALGQLLGFVPHIMPERMALTSPKEQIRSTIGSGPFIFEDKEWVPGSKLVFRKNPDYIPRKEAPSYTSGGKVVKVDRVEWHIIPDQATGQAALVTGEVDMLDNPDPTLVQVLRSDPNITVAPIDPLGIQGTLVLNHLVPPFNHPKARQAMLWMVNQEEYLRAIVGDPAMFTVCPAYFICGSSLETNIGTEPLAKQDLAKAKQLMKEAGYKGEKLVLMISVTHSFLNASGLVTAANLRKMGIDVDAQQMDWGTLVSRRGIKDDPRTSRSGWHLFHTATRTANLANPVTFSPLSGACDKAWFGWPCDQRIEDAKDEFAEAKNAAGRFSAAEKLQSLAIEVVPYINLGQHRNPAAWRSNLKGVVRSPAQVYWNISKN